MKHVSMLLSLGSLGPLLLLAACATNPNHAQKLDTAITKGAPVAPNETLGVKEGEMVVQKRILMSEHLRELQNSVYELQDHVYGNEEYGSLGMYGVLKQCRYRLSEPANGGDGHLVWTEPLDRVAPTDAWTYKIGLDEQDHIIGLSDEYLKSRLAKFEHYREILESRKTDLSTKIKICQLSLESRQYQLEHRTPTAQTVLQAADLNP